jgi:hypothetical protein
MMSAYYNEIDKNAAAWLAARGKNEKAQRKVNHDGSE